MTGTQDTARALRVVHIGEERARRVSAGEGTIAHAWDVYRARVDATRKRPKTLEAYRTAMKHAVAMLPPRPTPGDVEAWLDALHRRGPVGGRPLAAATCNMYLRCFRAVVERAGRYTGDHRLSDAAALAEKLQEPLKVRRCPPADVVWRAMDACRNTGERVFILLAATTGLRRDELLGVAVEDYDPKRRLVHVHTQKRGGPRKNKKPLFVEVGPQVAAGLEWVIMNRDRLKPRAGWHRGHADGKLFPWGREYLARFMERIRAALGPDAAVYFPKGTGWHAFRHLMATNRARAGAWLVVLQAALGDSSPTVAMTYLAPVRAASSVTAEGLEREYHEALRQRDLLRSSAVDFSGGHGVPSGVGGVAVSPAGTGDTAPTESNTVLGQGDV